jgi:hypothetical protein
MNFTPTNYDRAIQAQVKSTTVGLIPHLFRASLRTNISDPKPRSSEGESSEAPL